ncbi:hypothetical protein Lepto7375DRAFT_0615 [Leptolyngbya sp. PCC 7375]|nr:hypothetical protein Lepto7375DRAFT_0615 [Leptolyngbya sp. PCC 7375]
MKTTKTILLNKGRHALYVGSDLADQVKLFHRFSNQNKPLWATAEDIIKAGLKIVAASLPEQQQSEILDPIEQQN